MRNKSSEIIQESSRFNLISKKAEQGTL